MPSPALKPLLLAGSLAAALAASAEPPAPPAPPAYDAALAARLGADEHGLRRYILVVLKTGPTRVPDGPARKAMFEGHFANMERLAGEGKLAYAGPFDGAEGWRGMFILATDDLEEAKRLVATDPVIINGEMVAEYHRHFGSAALMMVNAIHGTLQKPAEAPAAKP